MNLHLHKPYIATVLVTFIAICTASAQVTKSSFTFEAPKVVNFTQIAAYEKDHPVILTPRFVEQGEDRDKFIYKPIPVGKNARLQKITPATTAAPAVANSPAATQNFQGVLDNGTLIPPDINGAVGTNYVIETTNQQFNIYTKSTGALASTVSITSLFSASGLFNYYDPHVTYDPNNNRFLIGIDAQTGSSSTSPSAFAVAISQTGDPTGSWYIYKVVCTPSAPTDFMDYDQLGFNNNWIVMTGNDFPAAGGNKSYMFVWPRATLYAGGSGTATTFTDLTNLLLSPATTYDATQNTLYLVSDLNGSSGGNGYVNIETITGTAAAPAYSAGSQLGINQPWADPSALEDAPQSGETTAKGLEAGDTRIHSCIYRNGSLWFTHAVYLPASGAITNSAVDWWQVNPSTLAVTQFDRISDPASKIWYYYPSLDINANGDMLIGFSTSSSTTFGGAQYALHLATDPGNSVETPVQYVNGLAGYYKTYGGGRNRWGDFSGTAFDPVDGSFWTFQEWANTGSNWGTQIAHIPDAGGTPTCSLPTGMTTTSIGNTSATLGWAAVSGATGYNVQYRIVGTTTWTPATTATNSYGATGLTAGSNYEWQVQTVCSATSTSAFTASTDFVTTGGCATPTGLGASSITTSGATLGWSPVTGAVTYDLKWGASLSSLTTVTGLTTTAYPLSGLSSGVKYYFEVQTICSGGSSNYSAVDSFTTVAPCTAPTGLSTTAITTSSATVGWSVVSSATSYTLDWGISPSSLTAVTGLTTTSHPLTGLATNTKYYFQVQSICASGSSSFSPLDSFTTSSSVAYCASKGTTTYEYIKTVVLGTINHTATNDGGYGNFTTVSTNLAAGTAYKITLTPGFTSSKYAENWTVYIDYNEDGVLNGTGETVLTAKSTRTGGAASGTFTVPTTAKTGSTRMRIQLEYGSTSTNPCATLSYGDVQDFTVNITGGTDPSDGVIAGGEIPDLAGENSLSVIPNPVSSEANATAVYHLAKDGYSTLQVVDLAGRVMYTQNLGLQSAGAHNYLLYNLTSKLPSGYYVVILRQGNQNIARNRFILSR